MRSALAPWTVCAALLLGVAGCFNPPGGDGEDTVPGDDSGPGAPVTWYQDIQPIVMESCVGCHFTGTTQSDFVFDSYEQSRGVATLMLAKILGDDRVPYTMPPFPPPDDKADCEIPRPIDGDPRLSDEEKAKFQAWVDQGMPEGDAATAAPYTVQPPPTLEGLDNVWESDPLTFNIPEAHDGDIDYNRCITLGLGLEDVGYIKAVEIVPDVPGIIHHVIIATDPYGNSDPGNGDGFATAECPREMTDSVMLNTWTLGQAPLVFPENSAYKMPAGGRIVLTFHYHMGHEVVEDHPKLRVQFADGRPDYEAFMARSGGASAGQDGWLYNSDRHEGWVDDGFFLPAGEENWNEIWKHDRLNAPYDASSNDPELPPGDYPIWAVFPHMHYAGSNIRISLERSDASETCLANIGPWDFAWQQNYLYQFDSVDQLPMILNDDVIKIDCHYNNSTTNERLMEGLAESGLTEPIDMTVGEGSLHEMCVMHYGVLMPMK